MASQSERTERTRGRIIAAARELFITQGYEATSTDQILGAAGISRGALYHHYKGKRAVFEAVFVAESRAAIRRAARGTEARDGQAVLAADDRVASPLETVVRACVRWLHEVHDPQVGRILIELGPQVLGWKRARDLETQTSLDGVVRGLTRAAQAGEIACPSLVLAARFLNAILAEAALAMRHGADASSPPLTVDECEAAIRQWIAGLRTTEAASASRQGVRTR
ncbi:MAG: helix-turn-helix domain-containing protein [Myxococcota bacterium]